MLRRRAEPKHIRPAQPPKICSRGCRAISTPRCRRRRWASDLRLIHANPKAAALIGLDPAVFTDPAFVEIFSGHRPFPGGEPLAMVYSGHQFGAWAGQLGDGRALLIAQVRNAKGELWDVQLKGAGQHALFALRRWPRRDALHHPRISGQRSDGGAGHSHQPGALRSSPPAKAWCARHSEPGAILTRLAR